MNALRLLGLLGIAILPSWLKVPCLRLLGAQIGRGCRIGFSLIDARELCIGDHVQIASFNLIHRVVDLQLLTGSRMNGFNWITGAGTGSFFLGRNSAITRFHFFEASGDVRIGENTIIAGRNTHLFTHGISATNLDDVRAIEIGSWCYVGSSSRFVPGCRIANGTFVGMGAVVTKPFEEEYVLLAGSPAAVRKKFSPSDQYFARPFLPHDHHPVNYLG